MTAGWGPWRLFGLAVLNSWVVEVSIGLLVVLSYVLMIVEADSSSGGEMPQWAIITNAVTIILYTVEVGLKICVLRSLFFRSFFNVLDLMVVVVDLFSMCLDFLGFDILPSLTALRIFRMFKLARGIRVIVKFPQLALMMRGLINAASATLYGMILLLIVLSIWSVIAVQFIHPINRRLALTGVYDDCARCPEAFSSVRSSMLTFFQTIIAGDSWGQLTMPIIEDVPETAVFFAAVFVSVHFIIMNVILAVIVDNALKASQDDNAAIVQLKCESYKKVARKLREMCQAMDEDGSGDLTLDELCAGYDWNPEFREHLNSMDIHREEIEVVHNILDADEDGTVSYNEFISELIKMKTHDSHTLLILIKHHVTEIRKTMVAKVRGATNEILQRLQETGNLQPQEKQQQCPRPAVKAEPFDGLGDELRSLREVISGDLLCYLKELSQQSETHRLLLASLPDDALPPSGSERDAGIGGAGFLCAAPGAAKGGPPPAQGLVRLKACGASAVGELELPPDGLRWPPSQVRPAISPFSACHQAPSRQAASSPAVGHSPASAWARRGWCSMEVGGGADPLRHV